LNAAVESVDDAGERWKKEKVSFAAAYGNERVAAYLFLPRHATPPYQVVVIFPGSNAIDQRSSSELREMRYANFIFRSGRAVIYPVYKSTFERGDGVVSDDPTPTTFYRDHVIQWSKDLGRTIDYIESRSDLDREKIALYGLSWGANLAPILAAVEDRIKTGVLVGGGFKFEKTLPEVDAINFAPRACQPMLMVNGRFDYFNPVETAQVPMFRLLGAPAMDKRHVVFEGGHVPSLDLLMKEVLDWLDRYLGPVK
jgi:cephalosporin-C deacetylase-like acetyl esterase